MATISSFISSFDREERAGLARLAWALLCLFPILGVVALVNVVLDPGNLFRGHGASDEIAGYLAEGFSVTNLENYNERLMQKSYVSHISVANEIVVLGSSRSMQLGRRDMRAFIGNCRFFNNSVSGAVLGDQMAIYGMYRQRGLLPKVLLLGLDPWVFNRNSGENRFLDFKEDVADIERVVGGANVNAPARFFQLLSVKFDLIQQVFSPTYFQKSLELFSERLASQKKITPIREFSDSLEGTALLADGSRWYEKNYREADAAAVRSEAVAYTSKEPIYHLGKFSEIDPGLKNQFEKFVALLRSEGVLPVFFLSPYHPLVYETLMARVDTRIIGEVERYLRALAKERQILLVGSYDPKALQLSEGDFYDGMHPKSEAIAKIFSGLEAPIKCGESGTKRQND